MNYKCNYNTLLLISMCLIIVNVPYLSQTNNNILTLLFEAISILLLISKNNKFRQALKNNVDTFFFLVMMIICTFYNCGISTRVVTAMVTGLEYALLFIIVDALVQKKGYQYVVNGIWQFVKIMVILADISILITKGNGIGGSGVLSYYIIGNKFAVSYYHMFFLSLFLIQNNNIRNIKKRKKMFFVVSIICIGICALVDCMTGVIGCLTVAIINGIIYNRKKLCEFLAKPITYVMILCGLSFLLIGTNIILSNSFFQNIIKTLFHRNLTLTGRLEMFQLALEAIMSNPFLGLGINSTYIREHLGWGNAQNGLLKILLDFGIVGTSIFILICFKSFKRTKKRGIQREAIFPLIGYAYGMAVCAMVEINLSGIFFLGLSLIRIMNSNAIIDTNYKKENGVMDNK